MTKFALLYSPPKHLRFEFDVIVDSVSPQQVMYSVLDGQLSFNFHVPAEAQMPVMLFASCNDRGIRHS